MIMFENAMYKVMRMMSMKGSRSKTMIPQTVVINKQTNQKMSVDDLPESIRMMVK